MKKQAFTLIEILIVVILLGILAAIVIPQFTSASEQAQTSAVKSDLQTVRTQLELYKMRTVAEGGGGGSYPAGTAAEMLTTLKDGGYLQAVPVNPFAAEGADEWTYTPATGEFRAAAGPDGFAGW